MSNGRIEIPLEEYNGMKSKIDEFEKILNNTSKEAAKYKEENELIREFLENIQEVTFYQRVFNWNNVKDKINNFLSL
jgi:hypothetical protein